MIKDSLTQSRIKLVYPEIAEKWLQVRRDFWQEHSLQIKVTDGLRDYNAQLALYSLGRTKNKKGEWVVIDPKKIVTHAKPGESLHNYGLALDSAFMGDDPYLAKFTSEESKFLWSEFGRLCKQNSLEWGGDWKGSKIDRPHCQLSYGLSISSLKSLCESGGLNAIWNKCDQITHCGSQIV